MRIVHVTDSLQVGGAERIIADLCRFQRAHGHDPSIHCLYMLGSIGESLRSEGCDIVVHGASTPPIAMHKLYAAFRRCPPDVVHCHNLTATVIAAFPARIAGVKSIVATRHGLVAPPYVLRRELKFALASRACDWIVAVCEKARNNLMGAPFAARTKIVRIYNGAQALINGGVHSGKSDFTLLHVARLTPVKDQETLLRAFALARTELPQLQLWIVGDGPLKDRLQALADDLGIGDVTQFFGEQADVAPFYGAADVFLMSSISEGLPMSLLEALSAGVPAIVTDVGGMSEVGELSAAARVVQPSSPEAMSHAICNLAQHPNDIQAMRDAARQSYTKYFTLERMAAEYEGLYVRPRAGGPGLGGEFDSPQSPLL